MMMKYLLFPLLLKHMQICTTTIYDAWTLLFFGYHWECQIRDVESHNEGGHLLEAPKLDLGRFFKILTQIAKIAKNAKNVCRNKTSIKNRQEWVGGGAPPPGGFQ